MRKQLCGIVLTALLAGTVSIQAWAQEQTSATELEGQLKLLLDRRVEILNRMAKLRQTYADAAPEAQKMIETEFEQLVNELQTRNQPHTLDVATKLFAADKTNATAGEVLVQNYYSENRYADAAKVGDSLIAAGKASPIVLNLCGASLFATHDFDKAKTVLTQASELGGPIFQQIGGLYLQTAEEYKGYWEHEQKIREKEGQADDLPRVSFKTNKGEIVIELFENEAPNTVANFINLVETKKYDQTAFHRVIPNFMAQGGDPNTLDDDEGNDGQGGPGYTIACECYQPNARRHFQGSLSMAHAGKDTGGSQFFITHLPTSHLNAKKGGAQGPSGHTVFGRVIKGLDIALGLQQGDKIESATVVRKRPHPYEPKKM